MESPARGTEYLLGRWLCNQLSPNPCEDDEQGLPYIPNMPHRKLNISHCQHKDNVFIAAVIGAGTIGIDVEISTRKRNIDGLSRKWFSPPEQTWLNAAPSQKADRFFRLWTAKESLIKAQRGSLAEHLGTTRLGIDSHGRMSNNEGMVSHYDLANDLILAIAHSPANKPIPPIKTTLPIVC